MAGLGDMNTAAQMAAAVDLIRFDKVLESFQFKPSIGISAKRFANLADELEDTREPLRRAVREVMTLSILENFVSGGRPKWDELSAQTLARHGKEGAGTILIRTGALADAASSESIWSIGKTTAAVRSLPGNVWYGYVHQAGQEGNEYSGGHWFKKYEDAARKSLGSKASAGEIQKLATKIWGQRSATHAGAEGAGIPEIPARPFIMFQDEDIDAIELIFVDWLETKILETII